MNSRQITHMLLMLLLLFSAITALSSNPAKASKVSVQWGCTVDPPGGTRPANEPAAENLTCEQIKDWFLQYTSFGDQNAYGNLTTSNNFRMTLQFCQDPYNYVDWATTWWVGDFSPDISENPPIHRGFYGYNYQISWDRDIFGWANFHYWSWPYNWWQNIPSKQRFNFIWTCANGGVYFDSNGDTYKEPGITDYVRGDKPSEPADNPFTHYGVVEDPYPPIPVVGGMPFALTGTLDMEIDGYASPDYGSYCYIGFENSSPWMVEKTPDNQKEYNLFPRHFYSYALGEADDTHHTIQQSLNYASYNLFGEEFFSDTVLYNGEWKWDEQREGWWYCRMRVLGNSLMTIPS